MDKSEIIKALECCCESDSFDKPNCKDCPADCSYGLMSVPFIQQVLALLKEQEPVQATQREVMHLLIWCCGSCGIAITNGDKFCRMCGRKVKWNG